MTTDTDENYEEFSKKWWSKRRYNYNMVLVLAGIGAFFLYAILGSILIAPYDLSFEITLFTIAFQGVGYLFLIFFANLCYGLGHYLDCNYNKDKSEEYRRKLYKQGVIFSICIPMLVPFMVVLQFLFKYC